MGKHTKIPLFDPNTGKAYDRSKYVYDGVAKKMKRIGKTRKADPESSYELPDCRHCINDRETAEYNQRARGVRKVTGLPRVNKVRTDAFGRPLGECEGHIDYHGKARDALREMGRIVPSIEEQRRANIKAVKD